MTWFDDIIEIFKRAVPGGRPGEFYMPPEGTEAVIKKLQYQRLPVVRVDEKGVVYTSEDLHGSGLLQGAGPGGVTYHGKTYTSYLDWTKKEFATREDPLGVNTMAARWSLQTGGGPVVRYEAIKSIDLGWLPGLGGAIIYDPESGGKKIKKVIYPDGTVFFREEITVTVEGL